MVACPILFLLAAAASSPAAQSAAASPETAVSAPARASVRILPGTRVELGRSADGGNYLLSGTRVRDETGRPRPARLVEFQ